MNRFQLEERHLRILKEIFGDYAEEAWIFGSRSRGTARPLSDIDVLFKRKIPSLALAKMRLDFEESKLPMKVDIVIWDDLDPLFQKNIQQDLLPFTISRS